MKDHFEPKTKAEKREHKNRPRMKVAGAALKRPSKFAGMKLAASRKKKR